MMLYAFHQSLGGFDTRLWYSTYDPGSGGSPMRLRRFSPQMANIWSARRRR
jgi:hypothetical protein